MSPSGPWLSDAVASGTYARIDPSSRYALFTSSGTFTAPAHVTRVRVRLLDGGGGGGGGGSASSSTASPAGISNQANGSGGAAAGEVTIELPVAPGTNYPVVVGAGGTGGTGGAAAAAAGAGNAGSSGNAGGASQFNGITYGNQGGGGGQGSGANSANYPGSPTWGAALLGGISSTGAVAGNGGYGQSPTVRTPGHNLIGGDTGINVATATAGGRGGNASSGSAVAPPYLYGGGSFTGNANGQHGLAATTPGCGGGAGGGGAPGGSGGNGGAGAPGQVEVWW